MSATIKSACALNDAGGQRGTGYLVAPNVVVTCAHVVRDFRPGGEIRLMFEAGGRTARLREVDNVADWAILDLDQPLEGVTPLSVARSPKRGDLWQAFGFPAIVGNAGTWLKGEVQDPTARDPAGQAAVALFSQEVAAGHGAPIEGFSGTPVIVNDSAIGHLKAVVLDKDAVDQRPALGLVYACPSETFYAKLPDCAPKSALPLQGPRAVFDPAWHIERAEEQTRALAYLRGAGQPVVLWGPQLSGKTWLLQYLLNTITAKKPEGDDAYSVVSLNADLLDPEAWLSFDNLARFIAFQIASDLEWDDKNIDRAWRVPGTQNRMNRFIEEMLKSHKGKIVLALDEADTIARKSKNRDDFFQMMRGWAEAGHKAPWNRLRIALTVSTTPLSLTQRKEQSPFHSLSEPTKLLPFDAAQARALAAKHRLGWLKEDVERLVDFTGGHPYLLRLAMFESRTFNCSPADLMNPRTRAGRVFDDFLEQCRLKLVASPDLMAVLEQINRDAVLSVDELQAAGVLERAGLVQRETSDQYRIAGELYKRLIDRGSA